MQVWRKLGRIFCPSAQSEWLHSHAAVPVVDHLQDDLFRIFFSSRDSRNRSVTASLILDIKDPTRVLELSREPVLVPGELGAFDDSGAMATWLSCWQGKKYLYYIGWNLGVTVPFRNAIGLAVEDECGKFVRLGAGPLLDRTLDEPHFCASCCALPGQPWRLWYLSCTGWHQRGGIPEHRYHIKYAESDDGIHWRRDGQVAIDYALENEYAISRPSVLRDETGWHMWYSHRGESYRIGYAASDDGVDWTRRDDEVGLDLAGRGWDSEMLCYPCVFEHRGERYMLYNGNDYGRSGFGIAVQERA